MRPNDTGSRSSSGVAFGLLGLYGFFNFHIVEFF